MNLKKKKQILSKEHQDFNPGERIHLPWRKQNKTILIFLLLLVLHVELKIVKLAEAGTGLLGSRVWGRQGWGVNLLMVTNLLREYNFNLWYNLMSMFKKHIYTWKTGKMGDSNLFIAHKRETMFTTSVSQLAFPQCKHMSKYRVYLAYNSRPLFIITGRSR